ncbi:MAG: DNA-binding response regulator, LuxR family [Candidatus Ozemobacter sibiricus]|jgi:DNA-binding NarL/FixJ family response regulator|uniref:DNA-binding response regulator, LuxR family n=1 Tax=Candidatus Ozemobacter sibiricus TaxID=2268124 RepID=A0A367ZUY1_9BACT|nr:MAG: DNA-binding response regulator, LuxR family [Candidatus Ozemobacter sibiricus]
MIRVLVVDDHPVVRRGIAFIVSDAKDIRVVGEAATGQQALAFLARQQVDVVILDLELPGENGLEVFARIKEAWPDLPVLILSMYSEEQYALRAIKAGTAGYLCKDTMDEVLLAAIRKVVRGGRFITPSLAEKLAAHVQGDERPAHERLSDREYLVMHMLAKGRSLKEIGAHLGLSIKTVSTYKARIFQKMGFASLAELVRYAIEHDLIEAGPSPRGG